MAAFPYRSITGLPRPAQHELWRNFEALSQAIDSFAGNPRAATIVVESSDSVNTGSNGADYTIATSEDAATKLALARDAALGGRVLLLDGTYNVDSELLWNDQYTELCGQGPGTVIDTTGGTGSIRADASFCSFRSLTFTGANALNVDDMSHGLITGCWFRSLTGYGIKFNTVGTPRYNNIENNVFYQCADPIKNDTQFGTYTVISGNHFYEGGTTAQIVLLRAAYMLIQGNFFYNASGDAVQLGAGNDHSVIGNHVYSAGGNGISFVDNAGFSVNEALVAGNYIEGCSSNGINIGGTGARRVVVQGNYCKNNGLGVGTFYGITVVGDDHFIHGNRVYGTSHDYAIGIINAASETNLVINNDLKGGYTTAAFNDTATGTVYNLDGSANNWNRT